MYSSVKGKLTKTSDGGAEVSLDRKAAQRQRLLVIAMMPQCSETKLMNENDDESRRSPRVVCQVVSSNGGSVRPRALPRSWKPTRTSPTSRPRVHHRRGDEASLKPSTSARERSMESLTDHCQGKELERLVLWSGNNEENRLLAGFLLVMSLSRSDVCGLETEPKLDAASDGSGLVEVQAHPAKGARTARKRRRRRGLLDEPWADTWLELRRRANLCAERGLPLVPAFTQNKVRVPGVPMGSTPPRSVRIPAKQRCCVGLPKQR